MHLGALEATLRHLTAAALPHGATRAVYVVDAYRSAAVLSTRPPWLALQV